MRTKNNESSIGDWLFLIVGALAIGGYMLYENPATLQNWLDSFTTTVAQASGVVDFATNNWGFILLLVALLIAALKMPQGITPMDAPIEYKKHKHLLVNLIR